MNIKMVMLVEVVVTGDGSDDIVSIQSNAHSNGLFLCVCVWFYFNCSFPQSF